MKKKGGRILAKTQEFNEVWICLGACIPLLLMVSFSTSGSRKE